MAAKGSCGFPLFNATSLWRMVIPCAPTACLPRHPFAIQLCEGNEEIIIMGNADTGKMRLIAEIDKKNRIARGDVAPKVD
jgi:hypothetical protein